MKTILTGPKTEWTNMGKRARAMKLDRDTYAANIKYEAARAYFLEGYDAEDRRLTKKAA